MLVIELCLWVNFLGTIQGALIMSLRSNSTDDTCILDEETTVINCTITPSTTTSVVWKKNAVSQTVCLHTGDTCVPDSSGRNIFTSDYQMYQFFFTISDVTLGTDEGTYTCEEGMIEESINISVCKVPTNVTISETETGTVTVTGTSDCVFPDSDVTFEWFYVPVLDPSKEKKLNISATRTSSVSGCVAGARTVTSSFQHANSSINTHEVKFRVKFYHPALASPVEANSINTYFLDQGEDTTEKPIDYRAKIGGGIGGYFGGVLIVLFVGYFIYKIKKNSKRQILDTQLTWPAMDKAKCYHIMRWNTEDWELVATVDSPQTSYTVHSRLYKWKIFVTTKDGKTIDIGVA